MNNAALKLALTAALGFVSAQASAAGFVALPATGFSVPANANYPGSPTGTSAYIPCNTTGNFGTGLTTPPYPGGVDDCAVFPTNEFNAPVAGFILITAANRPVIVNNTYTGGASKTVGNVQEYVWRNAAQTECIYGAKVLMSASSSADYLPGGSVDYFQMNDFARGGFGNRPIEAAYYFGSMTGEVITRIGRSYTSVQYRDVAQFAEQPLITPVFAGTINGIDGGPLSTLPTAVQQSASINENWVDFTTKASGNFNPHSSVMYVKTTCTSEAPAAVDGAIRLRQSSSGRFIEASVLGFAPPGAVITPAHVDPY